MEDCHSFDLALLSALPYAHRDAAENVLRSFQQSQVMLRLYAKALSSVTAPDLTGRHFMVAAFGSFGRLDGADELSDYDSLFIYSGDSDRIVVESLRAFIRRLVVSNKGLPFDHRVEIEAGRFDFDHSPAYPILSEADLLTAQPRTRAVQLTIEARLVHGGERLRRLREEVLAQLGFSTDIHELDFLQLRTELNGLKDRFLDPFTRSLATSHAPRNRKILKLFALREFSYLTTLLATVEVCIAVEQRRATPSDAATLISAPSLLKLLCFSDPNRSLAHLLNRLAPDVVGEVARALSKHVDGQGATLSKLTPNSPSAYACLTILREIALTVVGHYDALLNRLHNARFLDHIDSLAPTVTAWMGNSEFGRILRSRAAMIDGTKRLASALRDVLGVLDTIVPAFKFDQAYEAMDSIEAYQLRSWT